MQLKKTIWAGALVLLLSACASTPDLILFKGSNAASISSHTSMLDATVGAGISMQRVDGKYVKPDQKVIIEPGNHTVMVRAIDGRGGFTNPKAPTYWYSFILLAKAGVDYVVRPISVRPGSTSAIGFKVEASKLVGDEFFELCKSLTPGTLYSSGKFDCESRIKIPLSK